MVRPPIILVSSLALLLVSCAGAPSAIPTAPTSASAAPGPAPAQIPGERWNLTVVFRSVTGGPAACVFFSPINRRVGGSNPA